MMSNREKFERFHATNPHVYELFKTFALEAVKKGKKVLSIALITERIRWEVEVATTGDRFKLNNNYKAFYARMFHDDFPEYGEVFITRKQRSA